MVIKHCKDVSTLLMLSLIALVMQYGQQHMAMAATYSNVLVATMSVSSYNGVSSFNLNLPLGTPVQNVPVKLDVQSPFTTLRCSSALNSSSSSSAFQPSVSSTFSSCNAAPPYNSLAPAPAAPTSFPSCSCTQDTLSLFIQRTDFPDPLLSFNASAVTFTCCADLDSSIAAAGIGGFSKGDQSLPAQISKSAGLAPQFSYCLPSVAFFGRVSTYALLNGQRGVMETFTTSLQTRLYYVKGAAGYAFKLLNMSIEGAAAGVGVLKKPMKMRISTTQTYTTLERSVYKAFRQRFREAIGYRSVVKAVKAIEPFDTCFDTSPLYYAGQAPYLKTPTTSFQVEGGGGWGLYPRSTFVYNGSNSMVACMGFLKAKARDPSVLGTFQQMDCLAEFDLEHSRFGFRSIFHPFVFHPEAPSCSGLLYPMYPGVSS